MRQKYVPITVPTPKNRTWTDKIISKPPIWLSVDLGSSARSLIIPMDLHKRLQTFQLLQKMGFKHIAVGIPSAYDDEAAFLNRLVQDKLIQDDVSIQISAPIDEHLINKTFDHIPEMPKLMVQLQLGSSPSFREYYGVDAKGLVEKIRGAATLMQQKRKPGMQFVITLEGFLTTEPELLLEIWDTVREIWQASTENKVIFQPVASLQHGTINQVPDYIEWLNENMSQRETALLSFAAQNNRGTAVAAAELAILAGVERIAGSVAGIGERSGVIDLSCMCLNLLSQGVDPKIDFSHCDRVIERINEISHNQIPLRHPYLGELAFSSVRKSQHEIIKRCIDMDKDSDKPWRVPYLSLDPKDVGRSFEIIHAIQPEGYENETIRVIENHFGFHLPNLLQSEFSSLVHQKQQQTARYFRADDIKNILLKEYAENWAPLKLISINFEKQDLYGTDEYLECRASIKYFDETFDIAGKGNGTIDTLANAIKDHFHFNFELTHYSQHAMTEGANAVAATYAKITGRTAYSTWGLGLDADSTLSGIKAFMNALNRTLMINP